MTYIIVGAACFLLGVYCTCVVLMSLRDGEE